MAMAAALRSAALKFVASLNQLDCHVIHVAGEEAVFSCYDVVTTAAKSKGEPSRSMLTFYSDSPSDGFDTAGVDATVRAKLASSARRGTPPSLSLSRSLRSLALFALSLSRSLAPSLSFARALLPRPPSPPSRTSSHPPLGRRSHALSRTAPACRRACRRNMTAAFSKRCYLVAASRHAARGRHACLRAQAALFSAAWRTTTRTPASAARLTPAHRRRFRPSASSATCVFRRHVVREREKSGEGRYPGERSQ